MAMLRLWRILLLRLESRSQIESILMATVWISLNSPIIARESYLLTQSSNEVTATYKIEQHDKVPRFFEELYMNQIYV